MANWSNPTTSSLYTDVLDILKDRDVDLAKMFDGTTSSNIPTGAIKWNSTSNKFEKWSGSAWADLSTTHAFTNVTASGNLTVDGNTTLGNSSSDTVTINGTVQPGVAISGSSSGDALRITQTGSGNALVVEDSTSTDSTPFVINTSGVLVTGHDTALITAGSGVAPRLQTHGAGGGNSTLAAFAWATGITTAPSISLSRSKNATIGSHTILASNDVIGSINFNGSDGVNFIPAASVQVVTDGTPGVDSMPSRLVFSTTASGSSSSTERMRINSYGNVDIGGSSDDNISLRVSKNITGATNVYGVVSQGAIQSDATSIASLYYSQSNTAAASFTLGSLFHYDATEGTFGAGSTVTTQVGFHARSTLTGATNNYGFYSNVSSGTSRTISNVARTSNVVTITTSAAHGFTAGQSVRVSATTNTGLNGTFTIASVPSTTTFTYSQTGTDIASGADSGSAVVVGRWNFYAAAAAPNYFAGDVRCNTVITVGTSTTNSNTSTTATIGSLRSGIRTATPTANITLTLPTGTNSELGFNELQTDHAFEWSVINLASATYTITVVANTDHTVVGNMVVNPNSSGRFMTRKTAANTFVTYRIA